MTMTMSTLKLLRLSVIAIPALVLVGCGGKSKSVAAPIAGSGGSGLNAASNCRSKDDCPRAEPDFAANMAAGGAFVGWMGEAVTWKVSGIDANTKNPDGLTSSRRMFVLLDKVPEGSDIKPGSGDDLKSDATIDWTPKKQSSGKLDVIVRDAERCEMEKSKEYCQSYKFLEGFDKRFKDVHWEIKDRDAFADEVANGNVGADGAVVVSDPNCGGAPAATTDGQITAKVLGTFIQMLASPASILTTGMTMFSSGIGASAGAKPDPTQC